MKKLLKLVRKFVNGIDVGDDSKENFFIAIDFTQNNNIGSLVVYDREVSDIDMGVGLNTINCGFAKNEQIEEYNQLFDILIITFPF